METRPDDWAPAKASHVLTGTAAVFVLFALLVPGQFADPFVANDDWPVLGGAADVYYVKTLTEGRWVNWVWALRPAPFDPRAVWAIYFSGWALSCGFFGAGLYPRDRWPFRASGVALAVAVAPAMANLSKWFGTHSLSMCILAAFAAVAALGRPGLRLLALPLFVPVGLMTHGAWPLMMAAMALAIDGWRDRTMELVRFFLAFCGSYAGGLLAIFCLNWAAHGYFGVQVAQWRNPTPIRSVTDALHNLQVFVAWLIEAGTIATHVPPALWLPALAFLAFAVTVLARPVAKRLGLALLLALGANFLLIVTSGLNPGFRATYFFWPIAVVAAVRALEAAAPGLERGAVGTLLAILGLSGLWHVRLVRAGVDDFQVESRALAGQIANFDPSYSRVEVHGDPRELPAGGYAVQSPLALQGRLRDLLDRDVTICFAKDADCSGSASAAVTLSPYPADGCMAREGSVLVVRLPDTPADVADRIDIWHD